MKAKKKVLPNNPRKPGHYLGPKGTGYTLKADGAFEIAPSDIRAINEILAERAGLKEFATTISVFLTTAYTRLAKQESNWFDRMRKNLELSPDEHFMYERGIIRICEKEQKETPGGPA